MPIQNVGTLLENLVVTEAAALLLDRIEAGQNLGFATAFAMPALSEWRPHPQSVGISSVALRQIAESTGGGAFIDVMRRCLQYRSDQGPNGALLVSLVATLGQRGVSIWANDVVEGHYGNAIPSLEGIPNLVKQILPMSLTLWQRSRSPLHRIHPHSMIYWHRWIAGEIASTPYLASLIRCVTCSI